MATTEARESPTTGAPGALSALLRQLAAAPPDDGWTVPLRAGARVGRFELVRELGRGGFGVVWEGWDPELGRGVAIKCLRLAGAGTPRDARLYDEAEAAARLSHPNLVTLYDAGRAEQGPYLVLELLRGVTLAERLREGPLAVAEARRIAAEVARGVAHAHAHGIVHRDLKPENVFLCADGTAKVLDFGLAHAFGHRRLDGGTPGYMAPEQFAGAPEDERTDVFALGVLLHEMLVGERPFEGDRALGSGHDAAPLDVPGQPDLAALVARMLRKSPVERPRDAREVLDALEARRPADAPAPGSGRVRRRARGIRRAAVAAAAVLAAAASALAWRAGCGPARPGRASVAVLPFSDLSPEKDQEYLADGISEEIRSALSRIEGLRVVGTTSSDHFKGSDEPLPAIGARLNATLLVVGSLRRAGDRIRLTARLVNAADDLQVWSETYDRALGDVFAVQEDVARRVALALRAGLLPAAGGGGDRPARVEAYAELLRGRALLAVPSGEEQRLALRAMENAIALEPGYAAAHAGLCFAYADLHGFGPRGEIPDRALELGAAAADRALVLDPWNADAHQCRAIIRLVEFRWREAQSDLESAIRLDPRPASRGTYAWVLAAHGRLDEAIETVEAVLADDPLDLGRIRQLAILLNANGRSERARQVLVEALGHEPGAAHLHTQLALTDVLLRRPAEALAAARRVPAAWGAFVEALALHDLGRRAESDAALATFVTDPEGAYQVAVVHAWRGEADAAFQALDRGFAVHDQGLRYVRYDPFLRALRADPRYAALLRRMNLPVD